MILLRKAIRGIWRSKRAYIACIILMAIGIAVFVSFNMMYVNLTAARDSMYEEQRFADVFARVKAMPLSEAQALGDIPGIRQVSAAVTADARVKGVATSKIVTLRIASFDPESTDALNAFLVTAGVPPSEGEILLGQPFFEAHGFSLGETVTLIVGGRQLEPEISGTAMSPEYVYSVPEGGSMMPDPEAYGFAYMPYANLAPLSGKVGGADTVAFRLEDGVRFEEVRPLLEDALAPYGMLSLVARKDQLSHNMLTTEINSLGAMATSLPMMFISMASIILYIMLRRVIEQERTQIGILKAFGLTNGEVLRHYLCYGLFIGGVGGLLGVGGGLALADMLTEIYLVYFHLPSLRVPLDPRFPLAGLAISVLAGGVGSWMGARGILKLRPSEAMRPPAPPPVTSDIVGRIRALRHVFTSYGFMALRNITRSKFRSGFVVCGIAFSFCITAFMASYTQMMDLMLIQQFTKVQRFDLRISLSSPQRYADALEEAAALPGVVLTEGLLELPVELRNRHIREGALVTAMERNSALYRIYDSEGDFWREPPDGGLVLSDSLAGKLGVKRGDILVMTTPYTGEREFPMPILDIIHANLGAAAYISIDSLCAALEISPSVNGILLTAEDTAPIKEKLEDASNVDALTDTSESLKIYTDMLETYAGMLYMMQLAGLGIAFAIITNTASISLSERKREYATLRVLGMQPREIGGILRFEYGILTFLGILPGIPLTRLMKIAMADSMNTDMYSLPLSTPFGAYLSAALCCIAAVFIANLSSIRSISRFDMVEVLKERE